MPDKELKENNVNNEQIDDEEYPELSDAQSYRVDEVERAVYDMCVILTEKEDLEWNLEFICDIADIAGRILTDKGYKVRYPAIVEEKDGSCHIEDYVPPRQNQATC